MVQWEGNLEGVVAGADLLVACGDRIAGLTCSVSLRTEPPVYFHDAGTNVVERPPVAAASLVERIRSRLAREGFEETWPDVRRRGAIDASFLGAPEGRVTAIATRRGAIERVVAVACISPERCAVRVLETREECDAPGGPVIARLRAEETSPDDGEPRPEPSATE